MYRLAATRHQKQIMLKRLRKINQEGSAYNLLGLLSHVLPAQYYVLLCSLSTPCCAWRGCTIFERTPCRCAPQTLVSGTAGGRLAFVAEFTFDGVCLHCQDSIPQMRPTAG